MQKKRGKKTEKSRRVKHKIVTACVCVCVRERERELIIRERERRVETVRKQ